MKRDIVIDADGLLFTVAGNKPKSGLDGDVIEQEIDLGPLKRKFKELIEDIIATAEIESAFGGWKIKKVRVIFSDPKGNFRYRVDPNYKAQRKGRTLPTEFHALRKWAHREYGYFNDVEADDVVAYYVRKKKAVGFTPDKDLLYGVPGLWYDMYHKVWVRTTKEDAERFIALQTVAGDPTDGIPGIKGIGHKTAERLLEGDYSWESIVRAYESNGLNEEDAIRTRRLIGMDQVKVKGKKCKIKLFTPNK